MSTLATLLPGLLLSGLQAAASKRQRRRLIVVAGLGIVAFAVLSASCILLGWALFLAYGTAMMAPHWAAAAAGGTLLGLILVLGIVAALVWTYWPSHGLQDEIDKIRHEIEPLARKHPLASVGVAVGLGVLLTSILKR